MNAAIKYIAIPVVAVALIAVASTAGANDRYPEPAASKLATALETNDNVAGTIGKGDTLRVAVWFKAEPSDGEITEVCTKAGELGISEVHKMIVGTNVLEKVACP